MGGSLSSRNAGRSRRAKYLPRDHPAFPQERLNPLVIEKGLDPISDMYGIVHPEYNPMNRYDDRMINEFRKYDEVIFAGEAASHCVLTSVKQVMVLFEQETVKPRFSILTDCMSPIAGFEEATSAAFDELADRYGLRFLTSKAILD